MSDGTTRLCRGGIGRRAFVGGIAAAGSALMCPPARLLARVGNADGWTKASALLNSYVDGGRVPGVLGLMGNGQTAATTVAAGRQGLARDARPVDADTLWRVYSMTKPLTGMAAMMLVEEGRLTLDAPLTDRLPELGALRVYVDPDKGEDSRPAAGPITLRHLLTHTAGFGYTIINTGPITKAYLARGLTPGTLSRTQIPGYTDAVAIPAPDAFMKALGEVPLLFDPGTAWNYSIALDVTGILIERVTGMTLDAFLADRMFAPLGMTSSYFRVPDSETHRFADNHFVVAGRLIPIDPGRASAFSDPAAFAFGGAGLVCSGRDYDRFLKMCLGEGEADGTRIMKTETARLAMSNLLPPAVKTAGTMIAGEGFGAGGRVGVGARAGAYGWGGAAGTVGMADRRLGFRASAFLQYMPSNAWPFGRDFLDAVYADAGSGGQAPGSIELKDPAETQARPIL